MYEHKPQRYLTRKCMKVKQTEWICRKPGHCQCTRDIKHKTGPESNYMPFFQISGNSFGPYSGGVKNKGKRNERYRNSQG